MTSTSIKNTHELLLERSEEVSKERELAETALYKAEMYACGPYQTHDVAYYQLEIAIIDRLQAELDWLIEQSRHLQETPLLPPKKRSTHRK